MDDRVARLLFEDNFLQKQKKDEADIALLQKLATQGSVILQTLPVPGVIPPSIANALWQDIVLSDEFPGITWTVGNPGNPVVGQLGWTANQDAQILLTGITPVTIVDHYGIVEIKNQSGTDAYIALNALLLSMVKFAQFIILSEAMLDAGDGCILGFVDLATFEIDGTSKGAYFRREFTETNWHAVTTDGVGTTDTDTGIPFTDSVWYFFEIKQPTTGTVEFYINQILVATHTTNIYTADGLFPLVGMKDPGSTVAWGIALDYFAMQCVHMTQRWD